MKAQVLMLKQDDPFKCTSAKLVKFGLAQSVKYIPRYALTLNPFSENLLSKQDTKISNLVCAIDCSWEQDNVILKRRSILMRDLGRRLPLLLAANPINYSKLGKLSTAEALAGSLYILGYQQMANELMNKFKWGHTFLELNCNILEDYASAETTTQITEIEKEYFPQLS
jgi:pre-rRNA-processing protein TSR3